MNDPKIRELFEKVYQIIAAAEALFDEGFYDFSASRSYYTMFYSIEAVFLHQDRTFSRHKTVISAFGKEFIKTGIFPTEFHQHILDAFDLRILGIMV